MPTDRELLELIRQLYAINQEGWWTGALALALEITQASGGLVALDNNGFRICAQAGQSLDLVDEPPKVPGTWIAHGTATVRLRHEALGRDTLWIFFGHGQDQAAWLRLTTLTTHLRLATDFAVRRGVAGPLPGRLGDPDPERTVGAALALESMGQRAADCVLLAARGHTNGQICDYLDLSGPSVARALQEAYRHLEISGRSELDVAALLALPKPEPAVRTPRRTLPDGES